MKFKMFLTKLKQSFWITLMICCIITVILFGIVLIRAIINGG